METGGKVSGTIVTINDIDGLDGFSFEHLLGKLFKQMNYAVEVTRGSGDQGADIIISKMGRKTVVHNTGKGYYRREEGFIEFCDFLRKLCRQLFGDVDYSKFTRNQFFKLFTCLGYIVAGNGVYADCRIAFDAFTVAEKCNFNHKVPSTFLLYFRLFLPWRCRLSRF